MSTSHRDVLFPVDRGVNPLLEPTRGVLHRFPVDPVKRDVRLASRRVNHLKERPKKQKQKPNSQYEKQTDTWGLKYTRQVVAFSTCLLVT